MHTHGSIWHQQHSAGTSTRLWENKKQKKDGNSLADSSTNYSTISKDHPKPREGHDNKQVPKSIDVRDTDHMETDDMLGEEDLEEPLQMGDNDVKMINKESECSDDDTSYGSNSANSRGASLR